MPLTENDAHIVTSFLSFLEDAAAGDDRYGPSETGTHADGEPFLRFLLGDGCWLETFVRIQAGSLGVAFLTNDDAVAEAVEQLASETNESVTQILTQSYIEAGLDQIPTVDKSTNDGVVRYQTLVKYDDLGDLRGDVLRGQTLRMLEAYLLTFGPAVGVTDFADDDDDSDDED